MTAGAPHIAASTNRQLTTITDRQTARIHQLFQNGHSLDYIAERGVHEGWTRARLLQIVRDRGWILDGAGHLICRRPTGTPLQRLQQLDRQAARLRGALAAVAEERAQVLAELPTPRSVTR